MSHLSNPQAQRTLKFITAFACTFVGVQSMFFSSYDNVEGFEGKEHIFTNVQRDTRKFIDRNMYGIDTDAIIAVQQMKMKIAKIEQQERRSTTTSEAVVGSSND